MTIIPDDISTVPSTMEEAERLGLKRIPQPKKYHPNGILVRPRIETFICYIGPCVDGVRELCYYYPPEANGGCGACFDWEDPHCK